jgi:uncharacterized protein (DUF433 family)
VQPEFRFAPILLTKGSQKSNLGIDWSGCSLVESVPGKVSGVPILKGTRVQADAIVENYESGSPVDEISDNFCIPEETIREVLAYAAQTRHFQLT